MVQWVQAVKGLESQLHEITCENAALVSCADMRKSELDSALVSVAAVQHDSEELRSQLTKQSVDLDGLQKSLVETTAAKDKALQVVLAVPTCFAFSWLSCMWHCTCVSVELHCLPGTAHYAVCPMILHHHD